MSQRPRFSAARAAAALPDLPAPDPVHGSDIHVSRIGQTDLTLISDGSMSLPFRVLGPEAPDGDLEALMGATPDLVRGELSHALIRRGDALVLVDTGAGTGWQEGTGRLLAHMAANGIAPADVTHVVLTHLHPDHAWGTLGPDGRLAFPNASYAVHRDEVAFWDQPGLADRLSPFARAAVEGAQKVLRGIGDQRRDVVEGDDIVPGLHVLETPGHTPGHISLHLSDGLIVTGDAVVHDVVSLARPDWPFGFDMDARRAIISRRRLLRMAARDGLRMVGYHWRWPGLGRIMPAGEGFVLDRGA